MFLTKVFVFVFLHSLLGGWKILEENIDFQLTLIGSSVVPCQNNDSRESENGQPWKNWNCENHSQNCLIAILVHETGNFPKNHKTNVTINTK